MVHQFMNHISVDLWCTDISLRLINWPMDEGMDPVNWLLCKYLFVRNIKMSVILFLVLAKRASPEDGSPINESHLLWSVVYWQVFKLGQSTNGFRNGPVNCLPDNFLFKDDSKWVKVTSAGQRGFAVLTALCRWWKPGSVCRRARSWVGVEVEAGMNRFWRVKCKLEIHFTGGSGCRLV